MKKTDGTSDKPTHLADKDQLNDTKTNDINRQYEKALNSKDKPPRDVSNSRALRVSPDTQKIVTTNKLQERRNLRINNPKPTSRQNRLLRTKNNKRNYSADHNNTDDFDTQHLYDPHKKTELLHDIDSQSQSGHHHNNNDDADDDSQIQNKNITSGYKKDHNNLYSDSVNPLQRTEQNPNSAEYLAFLKIFVTEFNTIPENEMLIQKAMVQDTITQMFDQFLIGMNNFSKTTKQHHVFGQGAHLCQKILIALKNDNMTDAVLLVKRLIPKG